MLGGSSEWTDELWDEAIAFLSHSLSLPQAVELEMRLHVLRTSERSIAARGTFSYVKRDRLDGFREYPPTILLGIYDLSRRTW